MTTHGFLYAPLCGVCPHQVAMHSLYAGCRLCKCLLSTHASAITAGVGQSFEKDCPVCFGGQAPIYDAHLEEIRL